MLYDKKWDKEVKELDEVGQALLGAIDYIKEHGWCRGILKNKRGNVCLGGAIIFSAPLFVKNKAMARVGETIGGPITLWNDAPGRTEEEVIAILRQAAYQ